MFTHTLLSIIINIILSLLLLTDIIWYYTSLRYYGKNKRIREKIRTNAEQYTLKIINNLKTASLGSNFVCSFKISVMFL